MDGSLLYMESGQGYVINVTFTPISLLPSEEVRVFDTYVSHSTGVALVVFGKLSMLNNTYVWNPALMYVNDSHSQPAEELQPISLTSVCAQSIDAISGIYVLQDQLPYPFYGKDVLNFPWTAPPSCFSNDDLTNESEDKKKKNRCEYCFLLKKILLV